MVCLKLIMNYTPSLIEPTCADVLTNSWTSQYIVVPTIQFNRMGILLQIEVRKNVKVRKPPWLTIFNSTASRGPALDIQ